MIEYIAKGLSVVSLLALVWGYWKMRRSQPITSTANDARKEFHRKCAGMRIDVVDVPSNVTPETVITVESYIVPPLKEGE